MSQNPFEIAGRLTKAFALAVLLRRAGITVSAANLMSPGEWIEVAQAAGQKPPSEETIRVTLGKLAELEGSTEAAAA